MSRFARDVVTSFLLTPFYLIAVPVMLVIVVCDFVVFRAAARLGPRAEPKKVWEF
jgi:hypothetical protein